MCLRSVLVRFEYFVLWMPRSDGFACRRNREKGNPGSRQGLVAGGYSYCCLWSGQRLNNKTSGTMCDGGQARRLPVLFANLRYPVINKLAEWQRARQDDRIERKTSRVERGWQGRSALCEVAVVRGIGIIACMGQNHVGSWDPGRAFALVRLGCGVFLQVGLFPVSCMEWYCMFSASFYNYNYICTVV